LGPRCDPHPYELAYPWSFWWPLGAHRADGRSPPITHHSVGASPRKHFRLWRYEPDLLSIADWTYLIGLDLSPLSYVAGTLIGNPAILTICRSSCSNGKVILPANRALAQHNIKPISLQSKEHLGVLNGTAFSASVASLALNDAVHLALLAQILTAMGVESLLGTQASFAPFIHVECRPHPGQVEVADTISTCSMTAPPQRDVMILKREQASTRTRVS